LTNKTHISQIDDRTILFSETALGGSASIVGDVIHVSGYTHITGFVYSDVDSATDGLIIEQGLKTTDFPDGAAATTNVTVSTLSYTAADIVSNAFSVQIVAPYARVIYINGAGAQSTFRASFEARVLRGL